MENRDKFPKLDIKTGKAPISETMRPPEPSTVFSSTHPIDSQLEEVVDQQSYPLKQAIIRRRERKNRTRSGK